MSGYILAIDQGTTSSRAIIFDKTLRIVCGRPRRSFPSITRHRAGWSTIPKISGRVSCRPCARRCARRSSKLATSPPSGITNQRETALIWEKDTGKPIHNAIVWQDRRTAPMCEKLKKAGHEAIFTRATGLLLDPLFLGHGNSPWMLDKVEGRRGGRAEKGELLAGTVDSFLIWRLTGGRQHVTDATNASPPCSSTYRQSLGSKTPRHPRHSRKKSHAARR